MIRQIALKINITVYDPNENPDASPDNWHWDAETYTGVMALHDVQEMEGGDIEVRFDPSDY